MASKEVKAVCRKILKKVQSTHWTKGAYAKKDENGKQLHCLAGFINHEAPLPRWNDPYVEGEPPLNWEVKTEVSEQINILYTKHRKYWYSIEDWNDNPSRRREHVEKVLQAVIDDKEEK